MDLKSKIDSLIESIAERRECEVVESDLFQVGRRQLLRIYIDKVGGVTVGDCQAFSRELGAALDLEDLLPDAYTLEVSSPGLDRPLRSTKDFLRKKGREIRLGLAEPIEGRKTLVALLLDADEEFLHLELKSGEKLSLARQLVLQAKAEITF